MHFTLSLIQVDNVRFEMKRTTRERVARSQSVPFHFAENFKSDFDHDSPYHFEASFDNASTIKWTDCKPDQIVLDISIQNIDISKAKPFWHDLLRAERG